MKMNRENLARFIVFVLAGLAISLALVGRFSRDPEVIELHARLPENGGWSLETILGTVGVPIHLRLTSDDVVHGFAIGKSDAPAVEILPGEFSETTLIFDQPGTYTYYCTRWCSRDHWRMRGVIEITGPGSTSTPAAQPLYLQLGLDLDAPHLAEVTPASPPSIERGAQLADRLPDWPSSPEDYSITSPAALWQQLRHDSNLADLSNADLWDATAWLWQQAAGGPPTEIGATLYAQNCAACHGETGQVDGVMVRGLPEMNHQQMGTELVRPPDFSDPAVLLGASPALLQGKIMRGGMGTGMPYWGPILTEEEIQEVVAYLYQFAWQTQAGGLEMKHP
jgi:mono/diheme cytochrome c family protein